MSDNQQVPTGWYPDPTGRHELRYWAQGRWQASVSDANRVSGDPVGTATFPPPTVGVTAGAAAMVEAAAAPAQPAAAAPAPSSSAPAAPAPTAGPGPAPPFAPTPDPSPAPGLSPATTGPAAPLAPPAASPPATAAAPLSPTAPHLVADAPPTMADHGAQAHRGEHAVPTPTGPLRPPDTSVFAAPPPGPVAVPPAGSSAAVGVSPSALGRPSITAPGVARRRLRTGAPGSVAVAALLVAVQATVNAFVALVLLSAGDLANDFGDSFGDKGAGDDLNAMGIAVAGLAILLVATAIGLSMTARWAQVMAIVVSLAEIGLAVALASDAGSSNPFAGVVLPVLIVVLVLIPPANRAFGRGFTDESAVMT